METPWERAEDDMEPWLDDESECDDLDEDTGY